MSSIQRNGFGCKIIKTIHFQLSAVYHLNRVEVKCRSSLQQREELLVIDVAVVEVNFQGKKEGEQKLVLLIESPTGVSPDRLG